MQFNGKLALHLFCSKCYSKCQPIVKQKIQTLKTFVHVIMIHNFKQKTCTGSYISTDRLQNAFNGFW